MYTLDDEILCRRCYGPGWEYDSIVLKVNHDECKLIKFSAKSLKRARNAPFPIKTEVMRSVGKDQLYPEWQLAQGFITFIGGWMTEFPDSSTVRKERLKELFQQIHRQVLKPPVTLYWVIGCNTNPFTRTCVIVVKEKESDKLKAWLAENNYSFPDLEEMFN